VRYQFIEQNKQEFAVVVLWRVLGVSASGSSAWRKRSLCQRKREDAHLTQQLREGFAAHQGRYGRPPLQGELREQGESCSRKRGAR
jgi:putative transposase